MEKYFIDVVMVLVSIIAIVQGVKILRSTDAEFMMGRGQTPPSDVGWYRKYTGVGGVVGGVTIILVVCALAFYDFYTH